jgi:hypothetical protein
VFKYRERMADYVPRWQVFPRLHTQMVSQHSFFVALYTDQLTSLLKWPQPRRYQALAFALRHDIREVVTGDIMGPVKRMITNEHNLRNYEAQVDRMLGSYYETPEPDWQVRNVVKAANVIDEYFYLSLEVSLGNQSLRVMKSVVAGRMKKALSKIKLGELTDAIQKECEDMNTGLGFPQEDSDVD